MTVFAAVTLQTTTRHRLPYNDISPFPATPCLASSCCLLPLCAGPQRLPPNWNNPPPKRQGHASQRHHVWLHCGYPHVRTNSREQSPMGRRPLLTTIYSSICSVLLPVFFSYKALRTSDPALLAPWLMYWTTLALFLAVENQFNFILRWVPLYSWIRLGVHLYLVLPGQQGSVFIYKEHIHPFL